MRDPSRILYARPIGLAANPKSLRANSRFTTATRGEFLSSCQVKVLPESRAVPAAWKYSGVTLNIAAPVAAFDGRRSDVLSVKTTESPSPLTAKGNASVNPTDSTPGNASRASVIRFCIAGTRSPL